MVVVLCDTFMDSEPCALCLLTKPLLESHIIPEFVLDGVIEWIPTGRSGQLQPHMMEIDYELLEKIYTAQKGTVQKRLGFKERLLCRDCEAILQKGEHYVRRVLYGTSPKKTHTAPLRVRRRYHTNGWDGMEERWVDFQLFSQFQVGVFWRCCVAKGKAFTGIKVQPALQEQMRACLYNASLTERLLPCNLRKMQGNPDVWMGMLMIPTMPHDGVYNFYMAGYRWQYFFEQRPNDPLLLTADGHLKVETTSR